MAREDQAGLARLLAHFGSKLTEVTLDPGKHAGVALGSQPHDGVEVLHREVDRCVQPLLELVESAVDGFEATIDRVESTANSSTTASTFSSLSVTSAFHRVGIVASSSCCGSVRGNSQEEIGQISERQRVERSSGLAQSDGPSGFATGRNNDFADG